MPAKISHYSLLIKEAHLDTFGHVNNAAYLTLFEEARWEWMTKNNFGLKEIMATGIGPTILEINLRFMKELRLREEIIIESQMQSYAGKIGKLQQRMLRGTDVCCVGEFTLALFDLQKRKLILPTPEWLSALGMD